MFLVSTGPGGHPRVSEILRYPFPLSTSPLLAGSKGGIKCTSLIIALLQAAATGLSSLPSSSCLAKAVLHLSTPPRAASVTVDGDFDRLRLLVSTPHYQAQPLASTRLLEHKTHVDYTLVSKQRPETLATQCPCSETPYAPHDRSLAAYINPSTAPFYFQPRCFLKIAKSGIDKKKKGET